MNKISLLTVIILITASVSLFSELSIKPEKIREKEKVNFVYTATEKFTPGENLYVSIFTFTNSSANPTAYDVALRYDAITKKYISEFTLPANVIYALVNISNGKLNDNNGGNYWDITVLNTEGRPYQGAYLKNSVTYLGNLPISANREPNFTKAVEFLKKEIDLYPNNTQAEIGLTSLQFDLKMIDKSQFDSKMSNLVYAKYNAGDENDVKAMSRALKIMNNKEKADKIEADYAVKFPQSSLAEELYMSSLARASSRKEFVDGVIEYFNKYPNSINKDRISSALIDSYMQSGAYGELTEVISNMRNLGSGVYTKLAFSLLDSKKALPDSSKDYKINEALRLINIAKMEASRENLTGKPIYISEREWNRKQEINLAAVYESLGKIYMLKRDYLQAVINNNEALKIYGKEAPAELYESNVTANYEIAEYQKSYNTAVLSLVNSKSTDEIDKLFPILYKKLYGDAADYSSAFDSLLLVAKDNRIEGLKKNMLGLKIDLGIIETLNGIKIDLNMIKGKVIILEFWSTWCGPCSDVLSTLETLYNMYSENSNVLLAAVNIWEKGADRKTDVQEYANKGEFDLPVYLDMKDDLPKKLSISGLPTRIYIDKEGIVQFKEIGYAGADESVRNASDIIELLLKK